MKYLLLVLSTLFVFSACNNKPANPPAEVIDNMFTAMKSGNFEEMKKHITKQDAAMLDVAEKLLTRIDPEGIQKMKTQITEELKANADSIKYNVLQENIDGDNATVEVEISVPDSLAAATRKTSTQKFELVKEDNTWKIALSKPGNQMFNSMKGNMGAQKADLKEGLEKLQKMNPDSLKMLIGKGLQALDSSNRKNRDK